jgi:virulence-associated protein VapD
MAQYAIAFDLDTKAMKTDGKNNSEITLVYQREIPTALAECGFVVHPQGSLYHTKNEQDPIKALLVLQGTLKGKAPTFCKYVRRIHVFRMEEWSDITPLIADRPSAGPPTAEEELEEQESLGG